MGPGATKVSLFEVPTAADPVHHVLTSGPLQLGISCRTTSTPGEIAFTLYLTIPGAPSTLAGEKTYETVPSPVTEAGSPTLVEPKGTTGTAGLIFAAGPDGVPHLLYLNYGARGEASTSVGPPEVVSPRGCFLQAWEV
jgi:hypothetical protein